MYALILSLTLHLVFIMPNYAQKSTKVKKAHAFNLKISNLEVVPSQIEEQVVPVAKKTFHGKKVIKEKTVMVNKKLDLKGNKMAQEYFNDIRKVIIKTTTQHYKKVIKKGKVLAKIQIQADGSYDLLFVGGDIPELVTITNATFEKIDSFNPIPRKLQQTEIQLKVPLEFK